MAKILNDKDLEGVNGGVELEGLSKVPENDYDVVYKKDSDRDWEPAPINAGTYDPKITFDSKGNYKNLI